MIPALRAVAGLQCEIGTKGEPAHIKPRRNRGARQLAGGAGSTLQDVLYGRGQAFDARIDLIDRGKRVVEAKRIGP